MKSPIILAALCAVAAPLDAQNALSRVSVGGHVGVNASEGEMEDWRLGGHVLLKVVGPIQISPGFNRYAGEGDYSSGFTSGWQGWLNVRVSPSGPGWYVGMGLTVIHESFKAIAMVADFGRRDESTELRHVLLIGTELPTDRITPFLELQLLDLAAQVHLFAGVNIRIL